MTTDKMGKGQKGRINANLKRKSEKCRGEKKENLLTKKRESEKYTMAKGKYE